MLDRASKTPSKLQKLLGASQSYAKVTTERTEAEKREASSPAKDDRPIKTVRQEPLKLKRHDRIEFKDGERWQSGTVMSKAGKATTANKDWWNLKLDNGSF